MIKFWTKLERNGFKINKGKETTAKTMTKHKIKQKSMKLTIPTKIKAGKIRDHSICR